MEAVEDGAAPDPRRIVDLDGFIDALNRLREHAGSPPYRVLAQQVGRLLRPPRQVPFRTVADVFQPGRRRLDLDLVVAVVGALGAGESQVDAWRRALLRVSAEARAGGPIGVFRQLPADLAVFTGREEHLRRLVAAAGPDGDGAAGTVVVASIEGMAGVGKTQLAVHAAHRLVRAGYYGEVQLYVNLRGFDSEQPPADPAAVLEAFLRQLEVPAQRIPATLEERAAMFRDRLHGKNALIVLDNAAGERQVRDLIPGHAGCLVLITSRRTLAGLDGVAGHRLDVFTTDEALRLLERIVGAERVAKEPDAAGQLVGLAGHLPLAVAIVASYARGRSAWTLADVADRLARGELSTLTVGDRQLSAVFELSYQSLDPGRQRVFRLLSLHPGPDFTVGSAAALCGLTREQTQSALDALVDEHLLQTKPGRRFEYHDLLRAFAQAKTRAEDDSPTRAEAVSGALAWLQYATAAAAATVAPNRVRAPDAPPDPLWDLPRFDGYDDAFAWLSAEQATLTAAVHLGSDIGADEWAWKIAFKMSDFQMLAAQPPDLLDTLSVGLACAVRSGDEHGQSALHNVLAIAEAEHGSQQRAVEHFLACCAIRNRRGEARAEAVALGNLGILYRQMGRLEEASATLTRALRICQEIGAEAVTRTGSILSGLGQVRRDQGLYDEAEQYLARAVNLYRELGDRRGLAYNTNELATCSAHRGDLDTALKLRKEALAVTRRIGDSRRTASILEDLAADAAAAGHGDEADAYRREAAQIRAS